MENFNYYEYWEMQEPIEKPHRNRTRELGVSITGVPVSSALTKLGDALQRLSQMYNLMELEESGYEVKEMLAYMTEQEIVDKLAEAGVEKAITLGEAENVFTCEEWKEITQIPQAKKEFLIIRQVEEVAAGMVMDVSAFNTIDYLRNATRFDSYRYFTDKTAESARDLATLHSCTSDETGRMMIKQRYISLINIRYRNYGLRLLSLYRMCRDDGRKAELREKIGEQDRQIRRLSQIWKKYAYWQ